MVRAVAVAALLTQPALRAASPESGVGRRESGVSSRDAIPESQTRDSRPPLKPADPPAWATAATPGGGLTVLACDRDVVLRRPDGTTRALGPGRPLALAFAPGNQRLATVGPGSLVRTWDEKGDVLAETRTPAGARAVAYTPDGRGLLVLDAAGGITVHDPQTLSPVACWTVEGPANSIACSPDGRTVAVSFGSWLADTGWVECWSIPERRKVARYPAAAPVGATRFTPDGRTLVVGGWNGLVTWRSLPGGAVVAERQLPKHLVADAAFCPDAGTLPLDPPPEVAPSPTPIRPTVPEWVRVSCPSPER